MSTDGKAALTVVRSGMDAGYDAGLLQCLEQVRQKAMPFFVADSFKGITRHPGKLFQVVEYCLAHGSGLVTHNYYLSPTCAMRREPLLRPYHRPEEFEAKLLNRTGLTQRHDNALAMVCAACAQNTGLPASIQ